MTMPTLTALLLSTLLLGACTGGVPTATTLTGWSVASEHWPTYQVRLTEGEARLGPGRPLQVLAQTGLRAWPARVSASSCRTKNFPVHLAADGQEKSAWAPALYEPTPWLELELGTETPVVGVTLKMSPTHAAFDILVSDDRKHWTPLAAGLHVESGAREVGAPETRLARYMRLVFKPAELQDLSDLFVCEASVLVPEAWAERTEATLLQAEEASGPQPLGGGGGGGGGGGTPSTPTLGASGGTNGGGGATASGTSGSGAGTATAGTGAGTGSTTDTSTAGGGGSGSETATGTDSGTGTGTGTVPDSGTGTSTGSGSGSDTGSGSGTGTTTDTGSGTGSSSDGLWLTVEGDATVDAPVGPTLSTEVGRSVGSGGSDPDVAAGGNAGTGGSGGGLDVSLGGP